LRAILESAKIGAHISLSVAKHLNTKSLTKTKATSTGEAIVELIKVSATSRSTAVAGAIAGVVREHGRAEVQAIGAGAVNQAIKAAAIARGYLLLDGINVVLIPSFGEVDIDGSERTAVRFTVEPR
jgi:stage V sporulation protein S